jgi:hypothetical protein
MFRQHIVPREFFRNTAQRIIRQTRCSLKYRPVIGFHLGLFPEFHICIRGTTSHAKLAGFTDFDKLFRMKEVIITAFEVERENYQTYFQFVILV